MVNIKNTMAVFPAPPTWVLERLADGLFIPAHPLALTRSRKLDVKRQRALSRYYHAAGADGFAIGVHTTQFEIRDPAHGLLRPIWELAADTITACDAAAGRSSVRIAGICGRTRQAVAEAGGAVRAGYHLGLLSLAAFRNDPESTLIEHCRAVARTIPIFGFYLQPAVGGRLLSAGFWRRFVEIPNVCAIKIAAFNRYATLDVIRAVAESGRASEIALYTGNDDNILLDLLTEYVLPVGGQDVRLRFAGGLLGHWACWSRASRGLFDACRAQRARRALPQTLLTRAVQVTDCNAALFDTAHGFAGCIPGIHEVLRRQGLMTNLVCLDPRLQLSPGQKQEIDRIYAGYPELNDDAFVEANLDEWLR